MERMIAQVVFLFRQMTPMRAFEASRAMPQRRVFHDAVPYDRCDVSRIIPVACTIHRYKQSWTVHVYREGRLLIGVSVSADGNNIVSLTPHNIATFYLYPGYHQLTLRAGEISPCASFTAAPGEAYFFKVDYEHVVSATSLRDLKVSLSLSPTPEMRMSFGK
jgi:hypothetical protein